MYGLGEEFLACSSFTQDESRNVQSGDSASQVDLTRDNRATVDDLCELRGWLLGPFRQSCDALARALKKLGQEIAGEIEKEVNWLQPSLTGGLEQLGRESSLGKDDPDGGHRRRSGTQVEGQVNIIFRQASPLELSRDFGVDGSVVDRAGQIDLVQIDLAIDVARLLLKPSTVRPASGELVVGQQIDAVVPLLASKRRCYWAYVLAQLAFGCVVIGLANPRHEPSLLTHAHIIRPPIIKVKNLVRDDAILEQTIQSGASAPTEALAKSLRSGPDLLQRALGKLRVAVAHVTFEPGTLCERDRTKPGALERHPRLPHSKFNRRPNKPRAGPVKITYHLNRLLFLPAQSLLKQQRPHMKSMLRELCIDVCITIREAVHRDAVPRGHVLGIFIAGITRPQSVHIFSQSGKFCF